MEQVIPVYKPLGLTPLEAITLLKKQDQTLADVTISYAGRLDPMAEGLLLLLVGDENKKRKSYEDLPKTYTFSFLLGVSTDSYDLLGKITKLTPPTKDFILPLKKLFQTFPKTWEMEYPPYSSKPVQGKPLYYWARQNLLHTIQIPKKTVVIETLTLEKSEPLRSEDLMTHITKVIPSITGDFRQEEILSIWKKTLRTPTVFPLLTATVSCGSGFYVRGLVHTIGEKLHIPTTTFSITRTAIGPYTLDGAVRLQNK